MRMVTEDGSSNCIERASKQMPSTSSPSRDLGAAVRLRILVVEDDPGLGRCIGHVVNRCAGDATVVHTVRSAIEELGDVVAWTALILDVSLPDGSGLDILKRVRTSQGAMPALILTGLLDRDVANAAFELRAQYLVKPATTSQLEQFLRLNQSSADDSSCLEGGVRPDLPEDLHKLVLDVLRAAANQDVARDEYSHCLALLARGASGRTLSRGSAVAACADAAGVSRQTLENYVTVTARWSPLALRELLQCHDSNGNVVTMSHLRRLARAPRALRDHITVSILEGAFDLSETMFILNERDPTAPDKSH
jgi:DNA-binding response OmpR family regulator